MNQQTTGGATREAVKEYLQQYHMARERRRMLERRHDVLARELRAPAPGSTYMTMPASHPAADSEGAVSVVFRLAEVEDRIEAQRAAMGRAVTMVMDLIDLLPENSMERTVVVEMRHIDCKKWDRICKEVHMSRSRVNDYYNAALDTILSNKRAQKLVQDFEQDRGHGTGGEKVGQFEKFDTIGHSPVLCWYRGKRQGQESRTPQHRGEAARA